LASRFTAGGPAHPWAVPLHVASTLATLVAVGVVALAFNRRMVELYPLIADLADRATWWRGWAARKLRCCRRATRRPPPRGRRAGAFRRGLTSLKPRAAQPAILARCRAWR
jgi:hypothetical protein